MNSRFALLMWSPSRSLGRVLGVWYEIRCSVFPSLVSFLECRGVLASNMCSPWYTYTLLCTSTLRGTPLWFLFLFDGVLCVSSVFHFPGVAYLWLVADADERHISSATAGNILVCVQVAVISGFLSLCSLRLNNSSPLLEVQFSMNRSNMSNLTYPAICRTRQGREEHVWICNAIEENITPWLSALGKPPVLRVCWWHQDCKTEGGAIEDWIFSVHHPPKR